MKNEPRGARRPRSYLRAASLLAFVSFAQVAAGQEPAAASEGDLTETGRKLSNPVSDVWALFARFDLNFADGDLNSGDPTVGSKMIFQPILSVPLYGDGANRWGLIARPIIPVLFSAPVPIRTNTFDHKGGVGDIQLPTVISPPTGNWLLGAGPGFLFPTSTDDALGRRQWGLGSSLLMGYRTPTAIFGAFGQYYLGMGTRGEREPGVRDASYLNLLYFMFVNLPNAWQFGFNPTITYDARAGSGNRWNVPVGMLIAKTTLLGKLPIKIQFGLEYSVVSQDVFGERARVVLELIPVIPPLIRRPVFGGD